MSQTKPTRWTTSHGPRRIVCITEEWTEILYALGQQERIVGISAYTVRPPKAKIEKPVVSAFVGGSVEKIKALRPDLILGFSDVQGRFAKELIEAHLPVAIFNQRSVQDILDVIVTVGSMIGEGQAARKLVDGYVRTLDETQRVSSYRPHRPRVYFEEWDEPMICGSHWVSELIQIAGGDDIFATYAKEPGAKERYVSLNQIEAAMPDLMIASWCGKPLDFDSVRQRRRLRHVPAWKYDRIFEIPSEIILQPGPACLTDGLQNIKELIASVSDTL